MCGGGGDERKLVFTLQILLLFSLCLLHAINAGHYANFFPINGTFQNFNPVRRFLDGQVPYKDFIDYLGLGHLYLGGITSFLFGGDYQGSLQAFSFLTIFSLALIFMVLSYSFFSKKNISLACLNIFLVCLFVMPQIFILLPSDFEYAIKSSLSVGNSCRFLRGMIMPLSIIALYAGYLFYKKIIFPHLNNNTKSALLSFECKQKLFLYGGFGFVAGFAFPFSNDFGISCFVCLIICSIFVAFCRERKIKCVLIYSAFSLLIALLSILFFVAILTRGNILNWISSTFGTGGFQFWYYNSSKCFYIFNIDFSFYTILQAIIVLWYGILLYKNRCSKEALKRYGIPAFFNMTSFCALNEYKVLSGGMLVEVAYTVLVLTIVFEFLLFLKTISSKELKVSYSKAVIILSLILSISCFCYNFFNVIVDAISNKNGTYIEELGGNLTEHVDDLQKAHDFLNGKKVFATYASAQEVFSGYYQPSGYDYIIHVLGDRAREDYLASFKKEDFSYVATIKESFTVWENWVIRANWFFYRELFETYHPVFETSYQLYWGKNNELNNNIIKDGINLTVEKIDEKTQKIIVSCDKSVQGVADVYIDYSVDKVKGFESLVTIQTCLKVETVDKNFKGDDYFYNSNYLKAKSAEYIPIVIKDGFGEVVLTSNPNRGTNLILKEASCERIFMLEDFTKSEEQ